jgi:hypothetical protein
MLQALYLIAFAVLAVLAAINLIRNLFMLGSDATRESHKPFGTGRSSQSNTSTPHPELLDEQGRLVEEPLLVMKSISLEDAREQLDALFNNGNSESNSDSEAE